jgi:UDP-N-acetylmuramoyl-L-alanyl-D-glutamate--2,6-diaminopimelate ligase
MRAAATDTNVQTLGELLCGIVSDEALRPHRERIVTGVHDDSRRVTPGSVFVAVAGNRDDGRRYIDDAIKRGAAAIVGQALPAYAASVAMIMVADARLALAHMASRWHRLTWSHGEGIRLAGVTGTNGKTTTAFMVRSILEHAGVRCALFGTVSYELCGRSLAASNTTPGALELAGYLREAIDHGAQAAAMEVSSHALDQRRTDGLRFQAAGYTNLTGDHLDYHGTDDNYRAAKKRLFDSLDAEAVAVVNTDDPNGLAMVRDCRARVLTYALDRPADIGATIVGGTSSGTTYRLRLAGGEMELENALVGRHNVYNALCAAGLALALGIDAEAIAAGLGALRIVPGRLQRVTCASPADVFVDYAHTDDALQNVLSVLKPLTRGRLIVVFGCGGDRDRTKRPRMARAAARYADQIIVTSDNPRSEDPQRIIAEACAGFEAADGNRVAVEPDRAAAIHLALRDARRDDVVLIAGKGHENYQIVGEQRLPFDDVEVAIAAASGDRLQTGPTHDRPETGPTGGGRRA